MSFEGIDNDGKIQLNINGETLYYKILQVIEFNSNRKRMSIVVEDSQGNISLYIKGADNKILELINIADNFYLDKTMEIL